MNAAASLLTCPPAVYFLCPLCVHHQPLAPDSLFSQTLSPPHPSLVNCRLFQPHSPASSVFPTSTPTPFVLSLFQLCNPQPESAPKAFFAEPATGLLRAAGDNHIICVNDLGQTPDSNITPAFSATPILSPQSAPFSPLFSKCLENPSTALCFRSF